MIAPEKKCAGLYVDDLLRELEPAADDDVSLRHPMTFGEVRGRSRVDELAVSSQSIFEHIELQHAWSGAGVGGREWHGRFGDRSIRGVTVAQRVGDRVQVDIFLGSFPAPFRQAMRDACAALLDPDAWILPPGIETALPPIPADEMLDAKLGFGLVPDAVFTSPVACKPVNGVDLVERVCGHSVLVYGERVNGPRLTVGATTLGLWTGSVAGLPLEVASVIHWHDPRRVKVLTMAMRPWPVVALFQALMKARTLPFLDESYFEPETHLQREEA